MTAYLNYLSSILVFGLEKGCLTRLSYLGMVLANHNQVLGIELNQINESCKFLYEKWSLKFVVTVAQEIRDNLFSSVLLLVCSLLSITKDHFLETIKTMIKENYTAM